MTEPECAERRQYMRSRHAAMFRHKSSPRCRFCITSAAAARAELVTVPGTKRFRTDARGGERDYIDIEAPGRRARNCTGGRRGGPGGGWLARTAPRQRPA